MSSGSTPYEGDELNVCMRKAFDFRLTTAVVVSGDTGNFCGHMLLKVGGAEGYYFHTAGGVHSRPKMMSELGYRRYLRETRKRELYRRMVDIKNPEAAQRKVDELMSKPWLWLMLPSNCANFVETIVQAGGSSAGLYLNCPAWENFS